MNTLISPHIEVIQLRAELVRVEAELAYKRAVVNQLQNELTTTRADLALAQSILAATLRAIESGAAELTAARAVVALARDGDVDDIADALADYDATVKGTP